MENEAITSHGRLGAIQGLRAIAAALVVFQHVTVHVLLSRGISLVPYLSLDYGRIGVLLFFTISGFVMVGCLNQGHSFLFNRVIRIYPGFWIAIALTAVLLSAPHFDWHFTLTSALLLPTSNGNESYKIPYWTLIYEVAFYALCYVLILFRLHKKYLTHFCITWIAILIYVSKYYAVGLFLPGAWVLLSTANACFIFGMLCAHYNNVLVRGNSTVLAIGVLVCWSIGDAWKDPMPMQGNLLLAISFAGIIVLGIKHLRLHFLERLGNISYGVYLLHVPIALAVIDVINTIAPGTRTSVLWLVTFTLAYSGASVFGLVEFRLHRFLRRKFTFDRGQRLNPVNDMHSV